MATFLPLPPPLSSFSQLLITPFSLLQGDFYQIDEHYPFQDNRSRELGQFGDRPHMVRPYPSREFMCIAIHTIAREVLASALDITGEK